MCIINTALWAPEEKKLEKRLEYYNNNCNAHSKYERGTVHKGPRIIVVFLTQWRIQVSDLAL